MPSKILLNNEGYQPSEADLPCLITYAEKTGGSQFTMTLTANLLLNGSKILMLTAYPMARENFMEQVVGRESDVAYVESVEEFEKNKNAKALILKSGDEDLFLRVAPGLEDINERVVLIKNIEVFDESIFDFVLGFQKVIFSGDIDKCEAKGSIMKSKFRTIVVFSKPKVPLPFQMLELQKYQGYFWGEARKGVVRLENGG